MRVWVSFKSCVSWFHQIFIFSSNGSPSKTEKCFLFHAKSSFRSQDIQFFLFPSFPLFLPVDHFFRGWSKINLKVYDFISCINMTSITHFVWYLDKEKIYIGISLYWYISIDKPNNNSNSVTKRHSLGIY